MLEDVRRHTILGESIERINGMHRMAFPVSDVHEPDCYYKTMEIFLCHTTKHILAMPTSERDCQDWVDVMAGVAAASGRPASGPPLVTVGMAVTSPLAIHGPNVEIMKIAMRHGCVILPTVCPMAGTTSPYSVAGTALAANVESLLPTLLAQVYKPGHPVLYAVGPSVTDMRTGNDLYYRTEKMLFKMIGCRMARYYKLPISGEAGGTLTHRPDMQNGAESMMYLLASITGGQNIIGGLGSLHNANGMSAEQIVMQCGLVDMAEFVARGVDTSDRKLALDSIDSVGPGGNFLTDALTIDLLRSDEFFDSRHLDLTGGYVDGAPGMFEKAHEEVENRISGHRSTVSEAVRDAVRSFCQVEVPEQGDGGRGLVSRDAGRPRYTPPWRYLAMWSPRANGPNACTGDGCWLVSWLWFLGALQPEGGVKGWLVLPARVFARRWLPAWGSCFLPPVAGRADRRRRRSAAW